MKYTNLELKFDTYDKKFHYSETKDNQDRVATKPYILGMINLAWVNCPRGQEKKWKKRLFKYVENKIKQQITHTKKVQKALREINEK